MSFFRFFTRGHNRYLFFSPSFPSFVVGFDSVDVMSPSFRLLTRQKEASLRGRLLFGPEGVLPGRFFQLPFQLPHGQ